MQFRKIRKTVLKINANAIAAIAISCLLIPLLFLLKLIIILLISIFIPIVDGRVEALSPEGGEWLAISRAYQPDNTFGSPHSTIVLQPAEGWFAWFHRVEIFNVDDVMGAPRLEWVDSRDLNITSYGKPKDIWQEVTVSHGVHIHYEIIPYRE